MRTKYLIVAIAQFVVYGCTMTGIPLPSLTQSTIGDNTEKIFLGVPAVISMEGSTARLDDEWVITAAHNKPILDATRQDVYYHPTCDVALYKEDGVKNVIVGNVGRGDDVEIAGYPMYMPLSINSGKYVTDMFITNFPYPECLYALATASSASGMSGGGVYKNNELVGVYVGTATVTNIFENEYKFMQGQSYSAFVPLSSISEWVVQVTGKNYFKE